MSHLVEVVIPALLFEASGLDGAHENVPTNFQLHALLILLAFTMA